MVKDFSNVPVDKTITNNTGNKIVIDLRDILQIPVEIEDGDSLSIRIKTSEGLAILTHKVEELGLELGENTIEVATDEEFAEAIDNLEDGAVILLENDINYSNKDLVLDKNVTINLTNSTLNLGNKLLAVTGDVIINGEDGKITSTNTNEAVVIDDGGKLTLNGGTIESTKLYGIMIDGTSELVVNGGTIHSKDSCIGSNNTTVIDSTITINGGELTSDTDAVMYLAGPNTTTINGGTLNGGISARMGTITVNGGTINSITGDNDLIENYYNYSGNVWLGDAVASMAGTYTSKNPNKTNELNITINGGTINGLCEGCSPVTVYNLGVVEQDINVTIKDEANLVRNDETQPYYKTRPATDIVKSTAKDYAKYTAVTNTITEDIADKYKTETVIDGDDEVDDEI